MNTAAVEADLMLLSFQDSATSSIRDAIASKELLPADVYELQTQLIQKPSLRLVDELETGDLKIAAGGSRSFTFEIFGKPGLVDALIQIDYAYIGRPRSEVREKFHTRKLVLPLATTVNASIDLTRCNILPFSPDFAWKNIETQPARGLPASESGQSISSQRSLATSGTGGRRDADGQFSALLSRLGLGPQKGSHCLLMLDMRNAWPQPLTVSIQVRNTITSDQSGWKRAYSVHEIIQPGAVQRVLLVVPKMNLPDLHAPIPIIGNQRQFVVSQSKVPADVELANRENFWLRDELLKHVRGSWKEEGAGREGVLDIRKGIRLTSRMNEALRIEDIEFEFEISSVSALESDVVRIGQSKFEVKIDTFLTLTVVIANSSEKQIHALLRLLPSIADQPHSIALDVSKRFAWTGMLQQALHPPLKPGEARRVDLGITALAEGHFEVGASIEEIRGSRPAKEFSTDKDISKAVIERRIWHAKESCSIIAKPSTK